MSSQEELRQVLSLMKLEKEEEIRQYQLLL